MSSQSVTLRVSLLLFKITLLKHQKLHEGVCLWTVLTFTLRPLGGARETLHRDGGQNPAKPIFWLKMRVKKKVR